ncbi:MAG: alpha/beta fold hydrolase [Rhodobacter sp.]|uniref:alpha/beta fold hydrolase n=1 Tax=Pararhodobacter sp. TaxID=2127056 RepID=UPI001E17AD76|nr:alpha/beta hydrolase [Pararhodobacter sp.]MCB1344583.1 alpha/beta fold hydrolase [Paracoccaceae bacterium]MCC0074370.1 alpha/beta fold hydrolase [Rhodobacter sp.]HPD91252.1 alpha/beta hydrolase [Pararhodobacter sp.]
MTTTLLIPGLLCDRFCWEAVLARLPAEVADLSTQDDLTQMARDLLQRHPGALRVAGHSMGARVAMEMARLAPDRIERLALLDTGIHPLRAGETEKRDEIVRFAFDNGMRALADRWLPPMVWQGNQTDTALMDGLRAMVLRMTPELHARQIRALVNRPDAAATLGQVACPVLLMVGRHDQWSPVAQHEDMLALLPGARLEIIEDAGHFAPVERPGAVADILVPFLRD